MFAQVFLWNPLRPSSEAEQTEWCLFKESASASSVQLWHIVILPARFVYMWWGSSPLSSLTISLTYHLPYLPWSSISPHWRGGASCCHVWRSLAQLSSSPEATARISDVCCEQSTGPRGRVRISVSSSLVNISSLQPSPYPATGLCEPLWGRHWFAD